MPSLVVAIFLVAHGLIHVSFLTPAPPATVGGPQWPFDLGTSWALTPLGLEAGAARLLGVALIGITVAGYVAAALALVDIAPVGWFGPAVVAASIASIVLLVLFFHPWLVLGFAIDALLLWAVLVNGWAPRGTL